MKSKDCRIFSNSLRVLTTEASELYKQIKIEEACEFGRALYRNDKKGRYTYTTGKGRSGLVGEMFAMRLMHLYFNAHIIGDSTTPAIRKGDSVVAISGSGETDETIQRVNSARKKGAEIFGVTGIKKSTLGKLSDYTFLIPKKTRDVGTSYSYEERHIAGTSKTSLAPMGTLFEDCAMLFLDAMIPQLAYLKGIKEEDIRDRHFD